MKYLAECKNDIPHDEGDVDVAQTSWMRSMKSTKELLAYICSLEPHSLTVMMSISNATNMVSMMSKLLLDTMICIFKDVNQLEDKKNEAQRMEKEITGNPTELACEELNSLLHITETKIVKRPLGHTNVFCEAGRCATTKSGHIVYPTVCCRNCMCTKWCMYFCSSIEWGLGRQLLRMRLQ